MEKISPAFEKIARPGQSSALKSQAAGKLCPHFTGYRGNKWVIFWNTPKWYNQNNGIHQVARMVEMEKTIKIHVQKLPEGVYLATSDDVQGLVAQGRTVAETLEIARDVARKLIEAQTSQP